MDKGAICADGPPCAEIGKEILMKGGSAVDATIAAMFCNGIVTMQSMGLGGGFLMTVYIKEEKKAYSLNAKEKAPINAKMELYDDATKSKNGPLAIGVPGELKGYWTAYKKFGKLPWKDLIQPTIELCERGYNMTRHQHDSLSKTNLHNDSNLMSWFKDKDGTFKKVGSKIVPTKLCKTLRLIATNGGNDLYNGTLSKMLVEDIEEIGGIITKEDLLKYEAQWQQPISVTFNNEDRLFSAPPPGSGVLLGLILNILDGYNFTRASIDGVNNTVLTLHRMIEAFKYGYAKRTELGDTDYNELSRLLSDLTSKSYAEDIRRKISDNSTSYEPKDYGAVFYSSEDHGTAHLSILAPNGDAVSITSSVNIYFGSGHTSRQTGIVLNSVMDDFSYPNFKNYFGLIGSPANVMEPGKRPLSSMCPTIIIDKNGEVKMVVGASGGTRITSAVAQVIMRTLWFGDNLKEAIDAPRVHHQLIPMETNYEYGLIQPIVDGLKAVGHHMIRDVSRGSSIICGLLRKAGKIIGNADWRKGGDVYGL
ncbi:unnamed protein product [Acanthoscelides obtectus]|nr:unnamed protein product [Acanthoscelides obtectus]CAK1626400.1 Glutathione hydrolase 1 proenzyme [Acanthoscelides obtectus]